MRPHLLTLLGVLGLLMLVSIVLMSQGTTPPPIHRGIPGTASDPADTWVKQGYVSNGLAPTITIDSRNEYGLDEKHPDPMQRVVNQSMTLCARQTGIHGSITPAQARELGACIVWAREKFINQVTR